MAARGLLLCAAICCRQAASAHAALRGRPGQAAMRLRDRLVLAWARGHNATGVEDLVPGTFVHGNVSVRGLATRRDFALGQVVMRVPTELLIRPVNAAKALGHDTATALDAALKGSSTPFPSAPLALFLALELRRGSASPWAPYIASLPSIEDYRTYHPMLATDAELAHYEALPLVARIREERRLLQGAWMLWVARANATILVDHWAAKAKVTFDDFLWGYVATMSHGVRGNMVPVFDLINDEGPSDQNVKSVGTVEFSLVDRLGYFEAKATKPVHAGEELLSYRAGVGDTETRFVANGVDDEAHFFLWGFVPTQSARPAKPLGESSCSRLWAAWEARSPGSSARTEGFGALIREQCQPRGGTRVATMRRAAGGAA